MTHAFDIKRGETSVFFVVKQFLCISVPAGCFNLIANSADLDEMNSADLMKCSI